MSGGFLDTTTVIEFADPKADKSRINTYKLHAPLEMPFYALKELLSGHVYYLCNSHNRLLASQTLADALIAIQNLNPVIGRKKSAFSLAILEALKDISTSSPTTSLEDSLEKITDSMALRICETWENAKSLNGVSNVQSLACLNLGEITTGDSGELIGPNNSFSCDRKLRCSAAAHMYQSKDDINKLINSLHPKVLPENLKGKTEISSRRVALKDLLKDGINLNKKRCRALGDAYFVQMCPPEKSIVTTNKVDFLPMCKALGKSVVP